MILPKKTAGFFRSAGQSYFKKQPDFDPRNFGYTKLIDLIKNIPEFEIDRRATGKNNVFHIYVRPKKIFQTTASKLRNLEDDYSQSPHSIDH